MSTSVGGRYQYHPHNSILDDMDTSRYQSTMNGGNNGSGFRTPAKPANSSQFTGNNTSNYDMLDESSYFNQDESLHIPVTPIKAYTPYSNQPANQYSNPNTTSNPTSNPNPNPNLTSNPQASTIGSKFTNDNNSANSSRQQPQPAYYQPINTSVRPTNPNQQPTSTNTLPTRQPTSQPQPQPPLQQTPVKRDEFSYSTFQDNFSRDAQNVVDNMRQSTIRRRDQDFIYDNQSTSTQPTPTQPSTSTSTSTSTPYSYNSPADNSSVGLYTKSYVRNLEQLVKSGGVNSTPMSSSNHSNLNGINNTSTNTPLPQYAAPNSTATPSFKTRMNQIGNTNTPNRPTVNDLTLEELSEKYSEAISLYKDAKASLDLREGELNRLNKSHNEIVNNYDNERNMRESIEKERDRVRLECAELRRQNQKLSEDYNRLVDEINAVDDHKRQLEQRLAETQPALQQLQSELSARDHQLALANAEHNRFTSLDQEKERRFNEVMDDLHQQLNALKQTSDNRAEENVQLKQQNQQLLRQAESARQDATSRHRDMERLKATLTKNEGIANELKELQQKSVQDQHTLQAKEQEIQRHHKIIKSKEAEYLAKEQDNYTVYNDHLARMEQSFKVKLQDHEKTIGQLRRQIEHQQQLLQIQNQPNTPTTTTATTTTSSRVNGGHGASSSRPPMAPGSTSSAPSNPTNPTSTSSLPTTSTTPRLIRKQPQSGTTTPIPSFTPLASTTSR